MDDGANTEQSPRRGLRPPWKPGESGNPNGRPKGVSLANAIIRNLTEEQADEIAQRWIKDAMRGKHRHQSRESLTDRTDGKPKQAIEHSGPEGGPIEVSDARERLVGKVDRLTPKRSLGKSDRGAK